MNQFWSDILHFTQETAHCVGTQLLADFGNVQASQKADGSLVTQADKWADATIRDAIASRFPEHGIMSEEGECVFPDTEWCWIIDPVDGTTNFTRGVPLWGISLGLLYRGVPAFGLVHLPPISQTFHGFWQGDSALEGIETCAFLNERPIHSSSDAPSGNHFFNLCSRSTDAMQQPIPCKIRMLGAASYNFLTVANGVALGGVEATPKIWDIAGAWPIVRATGGVWVPLNDKPPFPLEVGRDYGKISFPTLVAARGELVPVFEPLVKYIGSR